MDEQRQAGSCGMAAAGIAAAAAAADSRQQAETPGNRQQQQAYECRMDSFFLDASLLPSWCVYEQECSWYDRMVECPLSEFDSRITEKLFWDTDEAQ
eukprot:COSAG01_NODE_38024_length_495_cov_1.265152_1_plen_96_part_01